MSPFATLPDLCLLALFKQLPPVDQLTTRKVCRRWEDLVSYAARDTRSLAIFVGENSIDEFREFVDKNSLGSSKFISLLPKEDGSPMFPLEWSLNQWNTLLYEEGLDEPTVKAIAGTFVNLDTLQIGLFNVPSSQIDYISHLLELWAHQLTTLKLYKYSNYCKHLDHSSGRLLAAINGLSTLKNLCFRWPWTWLPLRDLSIVSQLEQLRVYWGGDPHHFSALLRQHAVANTSLRVEYFCKCPNYNIEHFASLDDHLLSRFTHFGSPQSRRTNPELISTHFRHLTSLCIEPADNTNTTTLRRLFGHLSQLTQLLYLHLTINFQYILPDDQPHLLLPQLKSVKALRLDLTLRFHSQQRISLAMPNVEVIEFNFHWRSKCIECRIRYFVDFLLQRNLAYSQSCFRQMFVPFRANCTKLRAILYNLETTLGTAEELLVE